ncbi:protein of unknown function DUF3880 [Alkalidesulfovibrio alkalitolerans DSM 16529]|uniref:Uncharacterized protein n=1 Tax=Alkalidesulfovibrio alkalitolerans DSM 16529 TaxID=1121439 RepID=S7UV36_9BACT|nr:glycosyltransferase [Alkalidesulfovibrio alkalitolerans]EPR36213.1 protein of unknown function DUF3880 [Alkalidesulfovibrio alkalitolerans DSM 16529]
MSGNDASPPPYLVEPLFTDASRQPDGRPDDLQLTVQGKVWRMLGRAGAQTETRGAEEFLRAGRGLPVLLGAGLGHALKLLLAEHDGPVAVIDKETTIAEASGARALLDGQPEGRVLWIAEEDREAALAALTRFQSAHGGLPFAPIVHPLYARLDRDYYGALREALLASSKADFWGRARYAKFKGDLPRVLLITSQYFLMGEIVAACERLGAPHRLLSLEAREMGRTEFVQALLTAVVEFKPDFVFTVNHLGVDREGVLTELLARLELPLASWFVDNPHLILYIYDRLNSPYTAIFTWDADNLGSLKAMGFPHVRYLPLATDALRFRPGAPGLPQWRSRVSFVGNSMVTKVAKRLTAAEPTPRLAAAYPEIARGFSESSERSVRAYLEHAHPDLAPDFAALSTVERRLAFETLVTWEATRQYRLGCIQATLPFSPLIAGDPAWKELLPDEGRAWRWIGELSYYDDLPGFYPQAEVNFNCTSKQMKGAVNQRVFDVPAAGAFLVTDHREQIEELFRPGTEVVCYHEPAEAEDLIRYHLAHPATRERVTRAARERILAEHTYDIRLRELFAAMREIYG